MRASFIPWTDVVLAQAQPYHRVAWFLFGCIGREHRLNLDALSAHWLRAPMTWLNPLLFPSGGLSATPPEQASPVHASHQQRLPASSRAQRSERAS